MLLRLAGEAYTGIADETAAIMADVTRNTFFQRNLKECELKEWWGTSGGKEQRVYRQDELEDGSRPACYVMQIILRIPGAKGLARLVYPTSLRRFVPLRAPATFPQVFDIRPRVFIHWNFYAC